MTATIIPLHRPTPVAALPSSDRSRSGLTFWPEDQLVSELAQARLARARAAIDAADAREAADEARARAATAAANAQVAETQHGVHATYVARLEAELARRGVGQ